MGKLSHYGEDGSAKMVDVGAKAVTRRTAKASACVQWSRDVYEALPRNPKGDPVEVARIAGIQAAKRAWELIPMCHPLPLSAADVRIEVSESGAAIVATASAEARTGGEMEALAAASVAALTLYDMCKALDKSIVISEIRLLEKTGGKSGDYRWASSAQAPPRTAPKP